MASTIATSETSRAREDRNRATAIQHATLLQERKHTELKILEAQEELIDYPSDPDTSPSNPSSKDLASFRSLLAPFQVSDYDDLLNERNIAGKCGYVFCPRPYQQDTRHLGQYAILRGGKIVPQVEVRKWCSKECARRAMFIKLQLSETPAWERQGGLGNEIEILQENDEEALKAKLKAKLKGMEIGTSEDELKDAMAELALERGEISKSNKPQNLVKENIVVRDHTGVAEPPRTLAQQEASSVDGYIPHTRIG